MEIFELKKLILDNINNIDFTQYDQKIHGKGHYENLSILICNLFRTGFSVKEVEDMLFKLPINLTDKTLARRWYKSLNKTTLKASVATLHYFQKLLGITIKDVKLAPIKYNIFEKMLKDTQNRENKIYSEKITEYLDNVKIKHLSKTKYRFNTLKEFFTSIFDDADKNNMLGLATNMNESEKSTFNTASFNTSKNDLNLKHFTHWCINKPYFKRKDQFEGICESDIFNARYFLIEVDEGLSIEHQLKLADLMIDFGIPVKMVTYSGSRSIHIIVDLSIGILNKLMTKNMLDSPKNVKNLRNHCNITFHQYIPKIDPKHLLEYFGFENVNDYYKNYIKQIYDVIFQLGINIDYSCKNLNRWSRIPNGIRIKNNKRIEQSLLYFRDTPCSDEDVLQQFERFSKTIKDDILEKSEEMFNL